MLTLQHKIKQLINLYFNENLKKERTKRKSFIKLKLKAIAFLTT